MHVFYALDVSLNVYTIVEPPPGMRLPVTVQRSAGAQPDKTNNSVIALQAPAGATLWAWSTCDFEPYGTALDNDGCLAAPLQDFLIVAYDASAAAKWLTWSRFSPGLSRASATTSTVQK